MELEDNSGKCRLTLWRGHADSNVAVDSYVRATELVVQTYKKEKSLSTTYKTKLAVSKHAVILLKTFSRKKLYILLYYIERCKVYLSLCSYF